MESISPLMKNSSVRRLSLELVHKFATNLLTSSPVREGVLSPSTPRPSTSRRRASDVFDSTSSTSPILRTLLSLNPFAHQQPGHPIESQKGEWVPFEKKRRQQEETPRKSSGVTCHVIPPTPRRRASVSFSPQAIFSITSPPLGEGENKKQASPLVSPASLRPRRRSSASSTCIDLGHDLATVAFRVCEGLALRPQEVLGRGSFGTVVAATYQGREIAVKVLRQAKCKHHLQGELNGLGLPPHPHIVSVLDILRVPPDRALVLLERMEPHNLLALINDPDVSLGFHYVVDMSSQIASALDFCHTHGVLHLDVKPQNILLSYNKDVKLSDFGNSRLIADVRRTSNFTKLDGTVGYKAPELFRGEKPTERCDVYSLGITMWQLVTREQPYLGESEHSVIYKVIAQGLRPKAVCAFHTHQKNIHEQTFTRIYETAWSGNPTRRQSAHQLDKQLSQLLNQLAKTKSPSPH